MRDTVNGDSSLLRATIASERATAVERRAAVALLALLVAGTLAALPWRHAVTDPSPQFVAAFAAATGLADIFTAVLLVGLARLDPQRSTVFTSAAYLCAAIFVAPYALCFPGVVTPTGWPGGPQTSAWLWTAIHLSFPLLVIASRYRPGHTVRRPLAILAGVAAAAVALSVALVTGHDRVPQLVNGTTFSPAFSLCAAAAAMMAAAAIASVVRGGRLTSLRLWLAVALTAALIDTALNAFAPARYSTIWYAGKAEQFLTSVAVLVSLVGAWASLWSRTLSLARRLVESHDVARDLQIDLEREYRASTAFQAAALPRTLPAVAGLELGAHFRPAGTATFVGGDWFDAFPLDVSRTALVVGDVMGHGLRSAVTMNAVRQAIRGAALAVPDVATIMRVAESALHLEDPDAIVTAFVCIIDVRTGELRYRSAGHPPGLLRHADGSIVALDGSGLPLGLRMGPVDGDTTTVTMPPDSLLVLYTDGLIEAGRDAISGEARLRAMIGERKVHASPDPATALVTALIDRTRDDVAVLTARFVGTATGDGMPDGERWSFTASEQGDAARVRASIVDAFARAGASDDDRFAAELVFSELVGNVVRHGGGNADVVLCFEESGAVLHVLDRGPGFVQSPRLPSTNLSESGRGLFIVTAFASNIAMTQRRGGGAHVRATLPIGQSDLEAAR